MGSTCQHVLESILTKEFYDFVLHVLNPILAQLLVYGPFI